MTFRQMARRAKKMDDILRDLIDDEEYYNDWCIDFPNGAEEEDLEGLFFDDEDLYDELFTKFMHLLKYQFKRY